ncbi:RHS repeat-associated core domain-containing protein [Streptomyces sp. NPDC008079]|uniref:RHS repeat-associated core domain-containing protein n=1 Tax=Streptomyces sp. NPDC008079 TaxID=3364806 RepID=UPI0036E68766
MPRHQDHLRLQPAHRPHRRRHRLHRRVLRHRQRRTHPPRRDHLPQRPRRTRRLHHRRNRHRIHHPRSPGHTQLHENRGHFGLLPHRRRRLRPRPGQRRPHPQPQPLRPGRLYSVEALPQPYRLQSTYLQPTGPYKTGARYYDPTPGHFTQTDPSGQETNPYTALAGDPINHTDPNGRSFFGKASSSDISPV